MATLIGYRPTDPSKAYFRMNNHSWRTLAHFILDHSGRFLPEGEAEGWFSNEGHMVEETLASRIAVRLVQLLEQGIVRQYETELLIHYPPAPCHACNQSGVNKKGERCRACNGEGKINQVQFSEEKIKEFIEFILNCSGFDIS
ncbi:MAG: hypothetical protein WCO26_11575 [Deltaproteobacteria bacterium]